MGMALFLILLTAQDPLMTPVRLDVDERADDILITDVNGDRYPDLIIESGFSLRFHLFHPDRGFDVKPDPILRLPNSTFLWTLSPLCDGPLPTVVTTTPRGIHRYPRTEAGGFAPQPQDLIIHPNIFEGVVASDHVPLYLDFMPELTGDALRDALLFTRGELMVLRQERDRPGQPLFRLAQSLPIPIDASLQIASGPHEQIREITSVPVLAFGDFNADKTTDISYFQDDAIGTYFQHPDGRFSMAQPLAVGDKRKRRSTYLKFEVPPQIVDLNGDGLRDVVIVYASKGRAQIYLNHDGKMDYANPDAVLKTEDAWSSGAYIQDLDQDGTCEILMGIVRKFGIVGGIDVFISKRIDLELHIYRYDTKRSTYPNEPVQQLRFSIPYTFQATRDSAHVDLTFRPTFEADLDGDKRIDLLVEKDPQTIAVYRGIADRMISDEPSGQIAYSPPSGIASTQTYVSDFNQDGRSDLVLRYSYPDQKRHAVDVLLSRK